MPSYGLFVCPTNIPREGGSIARNRPLEICVGNVPNKKPAMFMVQKFVRGRTLGDYLSKPVIEITLAELKVYVSDIMSALIMMEKSPYRVSHNDLHTDNIFIEYVMPESKYNNQTLEDAEYFHYRI